VQTAEGALNETTSMLQRMRDLSVQANNASLDKEAKTAAQAEFSALRSEIDRVSETTAFGKSKLLDGSFGNTQTASSAAVTVTAGKAQGAQTFDVTEIGGKTLDTPLAINVPNAGNDMTPDEIAAEMNTQLTKQLKDNGLTGDEMGVSVKTDANGVVTFEASGPKSFKSTGAIADSANNANKTPGDFQIGANAGETLNINIKAVDASTLGLKGLDLTATAGADGKTGAAKAIEAIDKAITSVSDQRAKLGASQNRFEHTINNLNTAVENLSASESRIRDTDMAQEMVSFTRNQILTQAGTSMLSQANQSSQGVMSLLR
jgi:flagellin